MPGGNKPMSRTQKPQACKSCGRLIVFLITQTGKRIPINWDSLDRNEQNFITQAGEVDYEHKRHISHFADCPEAKHFRRPR